MKKPIIFNFSKIYTYHKFYTLCKQKLQLPEYFGNNLDALWDCITGDIELPVSIRFTGVTPYHKNKFKALIKLMQDAEIEMPCDFVFNMDSSEKDDGTG